MLKETIKESSEFLEKYRTLAGWPASTKPECAFFEEIAGTAIDEFFPGAILPRLNQGGPTQFYAVGPTSQIWRELRPLLLSFAGRTVTNFSGLPVSLNEQDPAEAFICELNPHAVAILKSSFETAELALYSLRRMRLALHDSKARQFSKPESTGVVLRRFRCALAGLNLEEAEVCINRLRTEYRLDTLNLRFLEVQLYSTFGEWTKLRQADFFQSLCFTRRPPLVSCALIETLYRTEILPFEEIGSLDDLIDVYKRQVQPFSGDLFEVIPPNASPLVLKAFVLDAAVRKTPSAELLRQLDEKARSAEANEFSEFWNLLREKIVVPLGKPPSPLDALKGMVAKRGDPDVDTARTILLLAAQIDTLESYGQASVYLSKMTDRIKSDFQKAPWIRELCRRVDIELGRNIPGSWIEWLQRLSEEDFTDSYSVAQRASGEWDIEESLKDPLQIKLFINNLENVPDGFASERLHEAIPWLVDWLRRDPRFPNSAAIGIYEHLLTRLALSTRRSDGELSLAYILSDSLLSCGLATAHYKSMLSDLLELAQTATGMRTLDWILDIMELTVIHPSPDRTERQVFLNGMLDAIMPFAGRLKWSHIGVLKGLAGLLGWSIEKVPAFHRLITATAVTMRENPLGVLAGLSIAVYTLTESVGKHFTGIIKKLIPGMSIQLNHDHVGTPRLKALAENADLFVIATQSAKHAATEFIRSHRQSKPVIFPKGKGSSSILRELEEYATGLAVSHAS